MKTHIHLSIDVELAKALDTYAAKKRISRTRAVEELIEHMCVPGHPFSDSKRVVDNSEDFHQ